ncbi:hypothetical protein C0995_012502 [Termitomyces sp. Mi166|nr:hypothetical protein C0995_012502 [Termitomyces sp. Mi166\
MPDQIQLTPDQIEGFREAFAFFDRDNDGAITYEELGIVMRKLGEAPTDDELQNIIRAVDVDHSGTIDFYEFLTLMTEKLPGINNDDELEAAFNFIDTDHSGSISSDELKLVLQRLDMNLTEQELDKMMKEADLDGNGVISLDEFKKMMEF